MEATVYDAGIAGSMTMIFLTLATVFLLRSFYKRWKRMDQRRLIFLTLATVFLLRSFYKRWKRMDQRRLNDENK